jgi:hypothetical protein
MPESSKALSTLAANLPPTALAEAVTFGMTPKLKGKVNDWELLLVSPCDFGGFERRATVFFDSIPKRTATKGRASAPP